MARLDRETGTPRAEAVGIPWTAQNPLDPALRVVPEPLEPPTTGHTGTYGGLYARYRPGAPAGKLFADKLTNCPGRLQTVLGASVTGSASSSRIWAFVPPMPKALTPALLGVCSLAQGFKCVLT